jgi:hypothetical protein
MIAALLLQSGQHLVKVASHLGVRLPNYVLSIASVPGDDVKVKVEHILLGVGPGAVDDLNVGEVKFARVKIDDPFEKRHQALQLVSRDVEDVAVVELGNDQRVVRVNRMNIEKGVCGIRLQDFPRWRLAGGNFAEDAVVHCSDPEKVRDIQNIAAGIPTRSFALGGDRIISRTGS